jgi:DNA uptake protein ComE-like DNA-binding protein
MCMMKFLLISLILCTAVVPVTHADPPKKNATTQPSQKPDKTSGRAKVAAKSLKPDERTKLLDLLNLGDAAALQSLPGIGQTRAAALIKARPFLDPIDLLKAEGIGEQTLVDIVVHVQAGFPAKPKASANSKTDPKGKTAK